MSNLESHNESLNDLPELTDISKELADLQSIIWNFEHIRDSDEYKIYSYTVNYIAAPASIRGIALATLKPANIWNVWSIKITDIYWNEYDETHIFNKWEKIYVKIPKEKPPKENPESEKKPPEDMKCKWWEYFWIDISQHNQKIDLKEFKDRNRLKWDSERQDRRWVSFVYIRASDWKKTDKKLTDHVNKIAEYNKDKNVINNKEKIAVWFYHRLNWENSEEQADHFIKLYKENKNKCWWNDLIPMCDVENWWKNWKWWMDIDKNKHETESQNKSRIQNQILTRLTRVESKTWVIPWIYIGLSNYRKYISWDKRFKKYETRIAAYNNNSRDNSFDSHWTIDNSGTTPTIYQSRNTWKVDGASNDAWYTDMDRTKDITKFFSKNNKSKNSESE